MARGVGANTPVRLTIGAAFGAIVFLIGVHPWAVAQVRSVVRQEFAAAGFPGGLLLEMEKRDRVRDRELARELVGIKLELRGLRGDLALLRKER